MPTWFIQRAKALVMRDRQDLDNGDELLFVYCFTNENDFAATLHEGGIKGVAQDNNDQDDDNDDGNSNMDEYPGNSPGIALGPSEARG